MDNETAKYIFTHFFYLASDKEKLAWKHISSTMKLEDNNNPKIAEIYKKQSWLTNDEKILELTKNGYESFEKEIAIKILKNFPDKVYFNNCPKCNKLARTPEAKQCRFCGFNWRNK